MCAAIMARVTMDRPGMESVCAMQAMEVWPATSLAQALLLAVVTVLALATAAVRVLPVM